MDLVIVTGLMYTVVAALCLWHLVEKFLSAVKRGGEERVAAVEGGSVVVFGGGGGRIKRRNEKRVRFDGVEDSLAVDRFEGVAEWCGSEMKADVAGVKGFGNVVEKVGGVVESLETGGGSGSVELLVEKSSELGCGGGDVGRDESGAEEKFVVEERLKFESILESKEVGAFAEAVEIGGVVEESCVGSGNVHVVDGRVEFRNENVVSSDLNEEICSVQSGSVDELFVENEFGESQGMDVEDGDGGSGEMEKHLKDEGADQIEECIRNIEGGVIEEGVAVDYRCKNEFEGSAEERFESIEEDDDWEGIEMSELYHDFTSAAAFFRKEEKCCTFNIGSEVKMQLYGLQKIVMEGPCREAQPMAIQMSARAKWNAWQRLGNMNPEDAMKQYITIIDGIHPEWEEQKAEVDDQSENVEATNINNSDPDRSKPPESQRKKAIPHNAEDIDAGTSSL